MRLADLIQNEAYIERLAQRDYAREGIEMLLALEDLTTSPDLSGSDLFGEFTERNALLAQAVQVTAQFLAVNKQDTRALHLALEAVAFHDFGDARLDERDLSEAADLPPLADTHAETAQLIGALRSGRFIRSVNFHNTFAEDKENSGCNSKGSVNVLRASV